MQKQAPSIGRILIAVGFTLSCFGLILFLWIAFGGPIPLKPKSYRITAYFPEATQLAVESDVRIGGVSVGKVKAIELAPPDQRVNGKDTTEAEIEIEPEFAPISDDASAILRQKTLLGETYVELTSGTEPGRGGRTGRRSGPPPTSPTPSRTRSSRSPKAARWASAGPRRRLRSTRSSTPSTRRPGSRSSAGRRTRRPRSTAAGSTSTTRSATSARSSPTPRRSSTCSGARRKRSRASSATRVRPSPRSPPATASSPGSWSARDNTFDALASQDEALAQTFQILPTFQRESRLTLDRLDEFQVNARPLVQELIPVARDLSPTLRSVRELSPHLRNLFIDLADLERVSVTGLPALRRFLGGLAPVLDSLDPFLANLNPVIRYLEFQKTSITDFLVGPAAALSGSYEPVPGDPAPRRGLRQLGYLGAETLAIWPSRLPTNRGNAYLEPGVLNGFSSAKNGIFPNFDCKNTDYTQGGAPSSQDTDEQEIRTGETVEGINGGNPPGTSPIAVRPLLHRRRLRQRQRLPGRGGRHLRRRPLPRALLRPLGNNSRHVLGFASGRAGRRPGLNKIRRAMALFKDSQEVYDTIGRLFVELGTDEELAPKFRRANTIVRYEYSEPESAITVRLQEGEPADVDFGDSEMEPEVTMTMAADTAHRFWLGQVNVTVALARGEIKAQGPVAKILKLVPLAKPVFPRYKAQLEEMGRSDLVNA